MVDRELLKNVIKKFGRSSQIEKIKEECLELSLAIQHFQKSGNNAIKFNDIIEEIADVIIVIEQAKLLFPEKLINEMIDDKILRLQKMIGYNEN